MVIYLRNIHFQLRRRKQDSRGIMQTQQSAFLIPLPFFMSRGGGGGRDEMEPRIFSANGMRQHKNNGEI